MNCTTCKDHLSAFIDKELPPEEASEVNEHLIRCASCRTEYDGLCETVGLLDMISFEEPEDRILKDLWKSPYTRWQRNAGIYMVIGGYASLLLYGLYEILRSGDIPAFPKMATAAVLIGTAVLLLSVVRERLRTYKVDRYKEVER